jgi:hypothetical protein
MNVPTVVPKEQKERQRFVNAAGKIVQNQTCGWAAIRQSSKLYGLNSGLNLARVPKFVLACLGTVKRSKSSGNRSSGNPS